ncbi:hypothetical protein AMTRI_Chr01g136200 [Amborella trichopoda]|uniref:Uncharacterized protein n=1 Tax=Amborella trichopoda TaxID=13333 RepID=W1PRH0_AMBTC|nr:uncharacterized protein LOC18440841 [Amborella trichopoda]ERN12622.1 hypothetical protein AMTR_s00025p00231300 [Amborella trichopoda]|eukprot:XP_006851041.1 uncharacterized protein LOC18440841 [Amborella trichopoda]
MASFSTFSCKCFHFPPGKRTLQAKASHGCATFLFAALMFSSAAPQSETLSDIPPVLSGEDGKAARIQKPKSRKAETCTVRCVTTCIRGGAGSPGEGPLQAIRPLVVFKQGFRSRHYCLLECSDICNLIKDGDFWP